ncbi:hypothetical protein MIND_01377000 [Mycena indigotica]|uniref:Uncharacterized protein n=1 Tax=Mycena indigotica TaxID=2126181 RepID=A0A8H6RXK2_9AGAR|nr:uncharacterized protein MIND_01377000 [Mycena indigotica]KAF7289159.1 hypothetical protein MIND_01377000 [Mycena indigotica]
MLFLLAVTSTYARSNHSECNDINNCRRLFDIVWGCLVTLSLCIWVSVHPNVPPPCPGPPKGNGLRYLRWWLVDSNRQFFQRLKLMSVALIAPELILGFAGRQLQMAHFLSHQHGVSLTHAFFIVMGGFVDADGHPIVTQQQLKIQDVIKEIHRVPKLDIQDKSKGDFFSKGIALCQGLWFITQCIARRAQHLPLTELEVVTLAFATINAMTWLLWLRKPLDVRSPITLSVHTTPPNHVGSRPYPGHMTRVKRFAFLFANSYSQAEYDPLSATSVPTFWCTTYTDYNTLPGWSESTITIFGQFACGTLFGGIHFAAWGAPFPSVVERWLWRSSTLALVILPVLFCVLMMIIGALDLPPQRIKYPTLAVIGGLYSISRGILLVLPLTTLRSLPSSAFADVNWSVYIPHL